MCQRDFRIENGVRPPVSNQFATTDNVLITWFVAHNVPPQATGEIEFERPDGTISIGGQNPFALSQPELARFRNEQKRGLFFFYLSSVDQRSHMLWRQMDGDHPHHEADTPKADNHNAWRTTGIECCRSAVHPPTV